MAENTTIAKSADRKAWDTIIGFIKDFGAIITLIAGTIALIAKFAGGSDDIKTTTEIADSTKILVREMKPKVDFIDAQVLKHRNNIVFIRERLFAKGIIKPGEPGDPGAP